MERSNTIGIIGKLTAPPELVVDAAEWERKVYETKLKRVRPSGREDTFILQFDGQAAGSEEELKKFGEGAAVMVDGEIRSENVPNPKPEESRVKVFIYAEAVVVNDPPAKDQNEARICGYICKPQHFRPARSGLEIDVRTAATSVLVAVNSRSGTNYIPCACFGWMAVQANRLKVGDYIEVYGRFQSRQHKKKIEGRKLPYLRTVYEVCAFKIKRKGKEDRGEKREKERGISENA